MAGTADLEIGQWSLFWPIVLSGACMSLIFVPLATTTMGTLRNEEIGNASGLYNLMRNVGGSIGISMVNTLLARREQVHRRRDGAYLCAQLQSYLSAADSCPDGVPVAAYRRAERHAVRP